MARRISGALELKSGCNATVSKFGGDRVHADAIVDASRPCDWSSREEGG